MMQNNNKEIFPFKCIQTTGKSLFWTKFRYSCSDVGRESKKDVNTQVQIPDKIRTVMKYLYLPADDKQYHITAKEYNVLF